MPIPGRRKVEFPFLYSKEGRLVHLIAELNDEPGALGSLFAVIGTKLSVIGSTSYLSNGGKVICSAVGKILSQSDTAETIQKLAAMSHSVITCQATEGNQGLLVDQFHRGLETADGEPCLLIPTNVLVATFEEFVKAFGSGGETIIYGQGMNYAKARWELLKPNIPHPESRFDEIAAMVVAVGWAVVKIAYGADGKTLSCVNTECFECSGRTGARRRCNFLRGMAVGLAEGVFGRTMIGEETRCMQKGDAACEFVIRAKDGQPLV